MWLKLLNFAEQLERKGDKNSRVFADILREIAEILNVYEQVQYLGRSEDICLQKIDEFVNKHGKNDKAGYILSEIKKLLKEFD